MNRGRCRSGWHGSCPALVGFSKAAQEANRIDFHRVDLTTPLFASGHQEKRVMYQDTGSFQTGSLPSSVDDGPLAIRTAAPAPSAEQEITRLTWSVLDGSASLADRQRLAELVDAQHAVRRRFDR